MRRPVTIKHAMEKLASHSGLSYIVALLEAIKFKIPLRDDPWGSLC